MLGLPALPTPEELQKLQEQRRLEIERRIQQEKQLALEQQKRITASPHRQNIRINNTYSEPNKNEGIVSPEDGWNPEFAAKRKEDNGDSEEMDPMLLQINIIRNYIKQAREAHKYDELHILEENLKELEIEYFVQQHGNQTQTDS
jgi:rabenosyn-5